MPRRFRRPFRPGLSPGTLAIDGMHTRGPVRITVMDYDAVQFSEKTVSAVEECFPYRDTATVTWINVDGLENTEVIEKLGTHYNIHPLILEDVLNTGQRPKLEDLEDYIYVTLKMIMYDPSRSDIQIEHVSIIFGKNFLISFQEATGGDVFDPVRARIRKEGRIRRFGPDYLAYALIDVIVDNYFLVIEHLEEVVENLEEKLVGNPGPGLIHEITALKKKIITLRKSVWPLREVAGALERSESPLINENTRIYLRDVYDHVIQVMDTLETLREMVTGMIDIYLSSLSYRMNEIMKVLTLIATIFIPLTFVAGVYGMNFEYMPELTWEYGYFAVWGVMILIAVTMLAYFRKRQWV
ncbi:MAG: magnesium/cobalt transporter CorA [Methanolinea sp.]|nr:magnesium/cobalt transporter CorA [Methanolinea sp.]